MYIKLCVSAILIVLFSHQSFAQDIQSSGKISMEYDRNSLTTLFMSCNGERHGARAVQTAEKITFSYKYNNNNLSQLVVDVPVSKEQLLLSAKTILQQHLNQNNYGRQILSKWYNRKPNGVMDMDLIFERGMFNATDAAYVKAQSTKRGNDALKDYGERLIKRSYIVVLALHSIKTAAEAEIKDFHGWEATVNAYVFRVIYNETEQNKLYDTWIYDEDTPQAIAQKNTLFNQLNIELEYVNSSVSAISAIQANANTTLGKFVRQKTDDELMVDLMQKAYDESLFSLERSIDDFKVKTTIYSVSPIRAKIGLKEGLRCDNRYFVYEHVYNEKTNSSNPVRRGVIRATSKIADNRHVAHGSMEASKFYQTAGRKLYEGYTLEQRNDFGMEIWAGGESGRLSGFNPRLDIRLGRYVPIKALFVYVDLGLGSATYIGSKGAVNPLFMRYSIGLAKGFQLLRMLELRPYVGIGVESASGDDIQAFMESVDDKNKSISSLYAKFGAVLALNLTHYFQITAGFSNYSFIGDATDSNKVKYGTWSEIFPDRSGIAPVLGVKLMF